MSKLNTINFKDYLTDSDSENEDIDYDNSIETVKTDNSACNEISNDNNTHEYFLKSKLCKIEQIHLSVKKIGQSIEYFKYNLENSKELILSSKIDNSIQILEKQTESLYNMILIEIKKNNTFTLDTDGYYIKIDNVKLLYVPKMIISYSDGIINIEIKDENNTINLKIGSNYKLSDNVEDTIDEILENNYKNYEYFNLRYNEISTIINYILIHFK